MKETGHRSELFNWSALGPRVAYLLLGLPLGIVFFSFTVISFSLGVATLIIGIGIPVLLFLFQGSSSLLAWERNLNRTLLGNEIPEPSRDAEPEGVLRRLLFHAGRAESWVGLLYSIVKLPLGVVSFILTLVVVVLPVTLTVAAFASLFLTALPIELGWGRTVYLDPLSGAALLGLVALVFGFFALLVILGLAKMWEAINRVMLSPHEGRATQPEEESAVVIP